MATFKRRNITDIAKPLSLEELRRRAKIVVIDDDPNSFPLDILRKEGYSLELWEKVESLDRLERGDFDIIVLDIGGVAKDYSLQHEDGLAILEHLKGHNPTQIIVAFSGQSFDLSKNRFWQMADDALSKPVDAVKCKQVIDQLLRERFTIMHYWEGFRTILQDAGLTQRKIDALEKSLVKAIGRNDRESALTLMRNAVPALDVTTRLGVIGLKILALCGIA
ncbi:MAG TPA: hypothetical protein PLO37_25075 [Candidatus Hydrogenedentes bacterium]|nr:hypothetical protein [Candidatus Hydrogenedentota bacterium]HPG70134.1 hypothetical protein [Candidatus Hydrogenedentota bacterium]